MPDGRDQQVGVGDRQGQAPKCRGGGEAGQAGDFGCNLSITGLGALEPSLRPHLRGLNVVMGGWG